MPHKNVSVQIDQQIAFRRLRVLFFPCQEPIYTDRLGADFCGTEALRDASRDLVEAFVSTLAEEAAKDRAALVAS